MKKILHSLIAIFFFLFIAFMLFVAIVDFLEILGFNITNPKE